MFDRDLVVSEFDTETLVSETYLTYILLAQIEAGTLPLEFPIVDAAAGVDMTIQLHPPTDYEREYVPEPTAVLPQANANSFVTELLPGNISPIELITFNGDGTRVMSQSRDSMIRAWDVDQEAELTDLNMPLELGLGAAFGPNGDQIASSSFNNTIRLWDTQTGDLLQTFTGHALVVESIAISADGTRLVSGSFDETVRLWDVATGDELSTLMGHTSRIHAVAFSQDGALVASGSANGTIRIWDVATGAELLVLAGHGGPVLNLAFSPDGTQLVSGSADTTLRLWDVQSGDEVFVFRDHTGDVNSVVFNHDGTRIASACGDETGALWNVAAQTRVAVLTGHGAPVLNVAFNFDGSVLATCGEDGKILLWNGQNGSGPRELSLDFMTLTVAVSVVDNQTGVALGTLPAILILKLELRADRTAAGLERGHRLRLRFARLHEETTNLIDTVGIGIDPADIEAVVRAQLDRNVPLGLAQGQNVQQIRMHKHMGVEPDSENSLGFYVDLALRSGPEDDAFVPPRGKISFAQNFRPNENPIAFATSPGLFDLLGPDGKFRQAVEKPKGSGTFKFPLSTDPDDEDVDPIGKIKNVTVGPELTPPNSVPSGRMLIDIHGEYTDAPGDPDFHLNIFFKPKLEAGITDWDIDADVDLGLLATIFLVFVGIGLTLFFGPALAWGSSLLIGSLLGLAVLKGLIAEPLATKLIEDRLDEEAQASILDALPFRVPAASRRWDPFYLTQHQIVAKMDEAVTIDDRGIAFVGTELTLDKKPFPIDHVVIRDEERTGGDVTALRYRVRDFEARSTDFEANGPGADRLGFTRLDPAQEPTLVSLTPAQITERIDAGRLRAPITYTAERIHLVNNQIDGLLCFSRRERNEERETLIRLFRESVRQGIIDSEGADIRADVTTELEQQLERPPTQEEIDAGFNRVVNEKFGEVIEDEQETYEEDSLPDDLEEAVRLALRFDLAPEEFARFQLAKVLIIDEKEIITRRNPDGTETVYYRDRPDFDPDDNLLVLPRYSPPYIPE